jgi:hypothetical protein
MRRLTKESVALFVLLASLARSAVVHGQIITIGAPVCGGASCGVQGWYQYWTTVSSVPSQYQRSGEFQIATIARNAPIDPPWQDGDWNIMAWPLSGSEDLLTNAEGRTNYNSQLELEIVTDFPLSSYFHVGDYISARGWHVEDWGHSAVNPEHHANETNGGKTELHPIIFIGSRSLDWPDFKLFAAQDGSGRFPLSYVSLDNYFGGWQIPLGQDPPMSVGFQQVGAQSAVLPVRFLAESAVVDIGVASMGANNQACWDQYHSVISAVQFPGSVYITPRLGPYGWCLKQGYFGQFHRSEEQLLGESITWALVQVGGRPVLEGTITATLAPPANHPPPVHTQWRYRETLPNGITTWSVVENPAGNTVSFVVRYAPALGLTQTSWALHVMSASRAPDWTPGAHRTSNGLPPAEERVFAQASVLHSVTPSSIALQVQEVLTQHSIPSPINGMPAQVSSCVEGYDVTGDVRALSGVAPTPIQWQVQQLTTSGGQAIANPPTVIVPSNGTSVALDGVGVGVTGNNKVRAVFSNMAGSPSIQEVAGGVARYFSNGASVRVAASYTTALGEAPGAETELSVSGCTSRVPSFADAWKDLEKLVWIMETLHEQGFGGTLPPTLSPTLVQQWGQVRVPLGPPERWYGRLPAFGQRLVDTYKSLLTGRSATATATADLMRGLRLASQLQDRPLQRVPRLIGKADLGRLNVVDTTSLRTGPLLFKPGLSYRVRELTFDSDGKLTRQSVQSLLDWSRALRSTPDRRLELTYTAPVGVSLAEAQRRASVIRQVLRGAGVAAGQITARGILGTGGAVPVELRIR